MYTYVERTRGNNFRSTLATRTAKCMQRKSYRRPRPSFAPYVNIKVYYFSISISDRTRNFLIYTRGRTAAAVRPRPGVVPQRYRAGCREEGERERESEVAVFAALALQTKPTPTCVRLFLLLFFFFFPLARFCRLSHFFLPSPLSLSTVPLSAQQRWRPYPKNVIKIYCAIIAPFDWIWLELSSGMRFSLRPRERISSDRNWSPTLPVTRDLRRQPRAFGFSRVTRASAARAWCSLQAQWAVSLCGSRMTLLHRMECSDVIPVATLKRRNDLHWRCAHAILRGAKSQYVNPTKTTLYSTRRGPRVQVKYNNYFAKLERKLDLPMALFLTRVRQEKKVNEINVYRAARLYAQCLHER